MVCQMLLNMLSVEEKNIGLSRSYSKHTQQLFVQIR